MIKPSDKNLGPVAMDKDEYVHQILKEHLLSKEYCKLTKHEATQKIETLRNTLKNYISSFRNMRISSYRISTSRLLLI